LNQGHTEFASPLEIVTPALRKHHNMNRAIGAFGLLVLGVGIGMLTYPAATGAPVLGVSFGCAVLGYLLGAISDATNSAAK
jgi:hypothetical protein